MGRFHPLCFKRMLKFRPTSWDPYAVLLGVDVISAAISISGRKKTSPARDPFDMEKKNRFSIGFNR